MHGIKFILLCLLVLSFTAQPSHGFPENDEDAKFLLLYYKEEELYVESATRARKPLNQVAENVTVVTADDIRSMNAHTLAELLNTVPGVQVVLTGGPGSAATAQIQGSDFFHVAVFLDGIPLNNLSNNVVDTGALQVQNIERIELIKGPASSAWGSALGGVINIITKTGADKSGGMVSASYGGKNTGDLRAEVSGKEAGFGYYLNAGRLQTDGFRRSSDFAGNNGYAKLTRDITGATKLFFTLGYDDFDRGMAEVPASGFSIRDNMETIASTLGLESSLNQETALSVSFWKLRQEYDVNHFQLISNQKIMNYATEDKGYGGTAKINWRKERHNLVFGADAELKTLVSNFISGGEKQEFKKSALFVNDTISIGKVSITPGARLDKTDKNGNFTSPSLGITYGLDDSTLFRAFVAEGFNIPPAGFTIAIPGIKMEKVWSYELGAETTAANPIWIKLSGFRHDVRDALGSAGNTEKQKRQGLEIEFTTLPIYHLSVSGGTAFMRTTDLNTGELVRNIPRCTRDLKIQFDDGKTFKAVLAGHYLNWNVEPSYQGKYRSFIVDLHVSKNFPTDRRRKFEIFTDVHNIFNKDQYVAAVYETPGRWIEGGVRYSF